MRKVYVCTGSCEGMVSQSDHESGKTTCGAADCEMHGKPLVLKELCPECGDTFVVGAEHKCE